MIRRRVDEIRWWHAIDLGHGIVTPGEDDTPARLQRLGMPESLRGMTVLDAGAWDGFFSFEAEKRGAARVLATDSFCWGGDGWGTKAGFELAREVLNSDVEDRDIDVLDLSPEKVGTFDVVLFLAVLFHMRHPLLALERLFSVTRRLLIIETEIDMLFTERPAMAFFPGREKEGDPTVWWIPNPAALIAMVQTVGFSKVHAYPPGQLPPSRRSHEIPRAHMVIHAMP
jgi:tRNA (mo5U34)-methyltransferase